MILFASRDCLCLPLCGDIFVPNSSILISKVSRIADSEQSVMLMLGRCLPHIVPNVLLAKREVTHDLLTQQSQLIFLQPLHLPCPLRLASSSHSILNSTLTQLNFFHCSCVCLSLSRYTSNPIHLSLLCSLISSLAFVHASHCSDREWLCTSVRWVEHIGTFSHQPCFLHHACGLWLFSWFGFSSASLFVSDSNAFPFIRFFFIDWFLLCTELLNW